VVVCITPVLGAIGVVGHPGIGDVLIFIITRNAARRVPILHRRRFIYVEDDLNLPGLLLVGRDYNGTLIHKA